MHEPIDEPRSTVLANVDAEPCDTAPSAQPSDAGSRSDRWKNLRARAIVALLVIGSFGLANLLATVTLALDVGDYEDVVVVDFLFPLFFGSCGLLAAWLSLSTGRWWFRGLVLIAATAVGGTIWSTNCMVGWSILLEIGQIALTAAFPVFCILAFMRTRGYELRRNRRDARLLATDAATPRLRFSLRLLIAAISAAAVLFAFSARLREHDISLYWPWTESFYDSLIVLAWVFAMLVPGSLLVRLPILLGFSALVGFSHAATWPVDDGEYAVFQAFEPMTLGAGCGTVLLVCRAFGFRLNPPQSQTDVATSPTANAAPQRSRFRRRLGFVYLLPVVILVGYVGWRTEADILMLKYGPATWRADAASELADLNATKAVPALIDALHNRDEIVRGAAASALGQFETHEQVIIPELIRALRDDSDDVAYSASYALAQIGKEAVPALAVALADDRPLVRRQAAYALMLTDADAKAALPALQRALHDEDLETRIYAAQAVVQLQDDTDAAVAQLAEALKHPDRDIRSMAASALYYAGPSGKSAVPALIQALKDENQDVRYEVVWALNNMGPAAKESIPALIEALNDKAIADEVKTAIWEIDPQAAVKAVEK